jgi:hypothetical protein
MASEFKLTDEELRRVEKRQRDLSKMPDRDPIDLTQDGEREDDEEEKALKIGRDK